MAEKVAFLSPKIQEVIAERLQTGEEVSKVVAEFCVGSA
jgi:hypothetical protein